MFRRVKNIWRKNALGKCTMYIGIEVIPRLFCSAFPFLPVTNTCGVLVYLVFLSLNLNK